MTDTTASPLPPELRESGLRVLVIGQGARDHALVWKLSQSPLLGELHAAPGNAAMERLATRHEISLTDLDGMVELALSIAADFVVVAFEDLLVAGLQARMEAAGIVCLGPSPEAAHIEGSKSFSKQLMNDLGVPTPNSTSHDGLASARAAIEALPAPVVVKADGLAGGRGAFVCATHDEAFAAAEGLLVGDRFGSAGNRVIVEQFVRGREASVMVLCDGETIVPLPPARDYKRLGDDNSGPNTGGMGACSPPPHVSDDDVAQAIAIAIRPAVDELRRRGTPYRGVLYAGVMFTDDGPLTLEYNCRFGNPETQVLVRLLEDEDDLLDLLYRTATGQLAGARAPRVRRAGVGICIASEHYPELEFEREPVEVTGLKAADDVTDVMVFVGPTFGPADFTRPVHALGGRFCTITATGSDLDEAARHAYAAAELVRCAGMQLRHDIGSPALQVVG